MEYLARVNPKYFAAMALFMAKQDVRYYLNGISVEPHPDGGAIIVATDGHRLAVIHDPDGWCTQQIIVGEIKKPLLDACKKRARRHYQEEAPAALWIGQHGSVVTRLPAVQSGEKAEHLAPADLFGELCLFNCRTSIVDGVFPNWRRLLSMKRNRTADPFPTINAGYLNDVSLAQDIILGKGSFGRGTYVRGVSIETVGANCSIVVRTLGSDLHDRFVALIMPMHQDPAEAILPSFLPQEVAPTVEMKTTLDDRRDPAVVAREHGWKVGTKLISDDAHNREIILITALGEASMLAKSIYRKGAVVKEPKETSWTLSCRDWKVHL
jgi:DNA polymerase-3 subunit beta